MAVLMVSCANSIPITCLEPSTVCQWWLPLAPEPQRHWASTWKEDSAAEMGVTSLACTLCSEMSSQVRFLLAELHKEEQLVIWCEHCTSTGFSPSPKASASRRRLDSSKVFWALVVTDSSLCACSQCSCSCPVCVCASRSRAAIVLKAVFYWSFLLGIMACGFAVEF